MKRNETLADVDSENEENDPFFNYDPQELLLQTIEKKEREEMSHSAVNPGENDTLDFESLVHADSHATNTIVEDPVKMGKLPSNLYNR